MKPLHTISLIIILIALIILSLSMFTVREGQDALILRLGKMNRTDAGKVIEYGPGFHWKIPFVTTDIKFDTRLQTLDIQSSRILTSEKKDLLVDYYIKWRISDLGLFYQRTSGQTLNAESLLRQKSSDAIRALFGNKTIRDVVSDDREEIMHKLLERAEADAKPLGIEVTDVRIKRIDLPTEVSASVYDRMQAERKQFAAKHRADGKMRAEAIRANADATATVTVASAQSQSQQIKAKGDAEAAAIYSQAYKKNISFYAFYRSLLAYQKTFSSKNDMLVLQPTSEFFKYFNQMNGAATKK